MNLSALQPSNIRDLMSITGARTYTDLRRAISAMPTRQKPRPRAVSQKELARCQRHAEIIDVLRAVKMGVNCTSVAEYTGAPVYQVWRDMEALARDGVIQKEDVYLKSGRVTIWALYSVGRQKK